MRAGVATVVFVDLVGSTQLKSDFGDDHGTGLIVRYHAATRGLLGEFSSASEVKSTGDGFLFAFDRPSEAVRFVLSLHSLMRELSAAENQSLAVRAGIHWGEVMIKPRSGGRGIEDLFGLHVDISARVMDLATGGQTLITEAAFDIARTAMTTQTPIGALSWRRHGPYRLKGVAEPVVICEVGETAIAPLQPPPASGKAQPLDADGTPGWAPAVGATVPSTNWTLERALGKGGLERFGWHPTAGWRAARLSSSSARTRRRFEVSFVS